MNYVLTEHFDARVKDILLTVANLHSYNFETYLILPRPMPGNSCSRRLIWDNILISNFVNYDMSVT